MKKHHLSTEPSGNPAHLNSFQFMKLPKEIRGMIYQQLPKREAVKMRLVSKQCRSEIDELYTVKHAVIRKNNAHFERVFLQRVAKCYIVNFNWMQLDSIHGCGLVGKWKYPHLVKTLGLFWYIWEDDGDTLEENFRQLTTQLSNLKRIELNVELPEKSRVVSNYMSSIFALLGSNYSTLVKLEITIKREHAYRKGQRESRLRKADLDNINFDSLAKLQSVKYFKLHNTSNTCSAIWFKLISQQRNLEHLEIQYPHVFDELPKLLTLDTQNFRTVQKLTIIEDSTWCFYPNFEFPFDLSAFKIFLNLKHLVIRGSREGMVVTNRNRLPVSVTDLILERVTLMN